MYNALHIFSTVLFFAGVAVCSAVTGDPSYLLTLLAVAIHEAGHFFASLISGDRLRRFSLQTGGLRLSSAKPYSSYSSEAVIAFAGPFFNLITATSLYSAKAPLPIYFRQVSLALAFLNLLPVSGFDGGSLMRCALSFFLPPLTVEKICAVLSFLSLFTLWSLSVYLLMRSGRSISLFAFSAVIFIRLLKKEASTQIIELIRE